MFFPASRVMSLELLPLSLPSSPSSPLLPPPLPNPGHSSTLIIIPSLTLWSLSQTPTSSEGDHMTYHAHLLPWAGIDLSVDWGCYVHAINGCSSLAAGILPGGLACQTSLLLVQGERGERGSPVVVVGPVVVTKLFTPHRYVHVDRGHAGFGFTLSGNAPVFIRSVDPQGAAARAGLRPGDQIVELNGLNIRYLCVTARQNIVSTHLSICLSIYVPIYVSIYPTFFLLGMQHTPMLSGC